MPKLNLLELCLSPAIGGLELYMVHAAKALNDEFNVLSVVASGSQLEPYFQDEQYKSIAIKHKGDSSFLSARKIAKIIDDNHIDVVHIHWTSDLPTMAMALFMSKRKPKLIQSRHMNMTRFKNDIYHRYLYKKMDMILTVTSQLAEQVKKYIPLSVRPRVQTLYIGSEKVNMLDDKVIQEYKDELGIKDEMMIGMVGRIEEAKGQHLLIEAIEKLKSKGVSVKVFFVGHVMNEAYLSTLQSLVKDKGLENEINFLGFTKEPLRFMQACDMMVLATRCETFGLVLIEAMQVGTPVIATNQCGPLEIIEDGKSGLLFEVDNSNDLYEKLLALSENVSKRNEMASVAKRRAEEMFSSAKQFKKLSDIIKDL
jgi:glycosyltransferase involved in cell wall biosynthesis